jgi:RNA polymerase sigma factor (sigma-70 family)
LLHEAIAQLPPQRKQVYTLCKLEGKSNEEAGRELGISTATIRNQIVKANKAVKQYFLLNHDIAIVLITAHMLKHLK